MKNAVTVNFINDEDVRRPTKASEGAAGYDIVSTDVKFDPLTRRATVSTSLRVSFPNTHVLKIFGRSGLSWKGVQLINSVAIIDSDYRGEILLRFTIPHEFLEKDVEFLLGPGNRVAQAMLEELTPIAWIGRDSLNETQRGTGGFGSTGA